jgi:hypothetical protein
MRDMKHTLLLLTAGFALACATRETSLDGGETGSDTASSSGAGESDTTDTIDTEFSCSVLAQDCPAGHKCTYSSHETPLTVCVAVSEFGLSGQAGQPCTSEGNGVDTCDATSMCWGWWKHQPSWDPDPPGDCVLYCTDTPEDPQCADGKVCGPEGFFLCVHDCDAFLQNCPTGQKCVPYSSDGSPFFTYEAYKCVDIGGDQQPGESCISDGVATMNDDCALGGFCANVVADGDLLLGECFGMCTGWPDDPSCPPGQVCDLWGQGGPFVCETPCDPLANDCKPGTGCHWWTGFDCLPTTDDIPVGEPCAHTGQCTAGAFCADASVLPTCSDSSCCVPHCNLLEPDCSELPGTECAPFFELGMAPSGFEHIGVCIVMP